MAEAGRIQRFIPVKNIGSCFPRILKQKNNKIIPKVDEGHPEQIQNRSEESQNLLETNKDLFEKIKNLSEENQNFREEIKILHDALGQLRTVE